ncbi:twin-arginine translocase TatA/TatE family subunit [Microbacterium sp. No. 7]|uniref:twin-arginine translocase TatA/TatE family subunit n=1 Tax=Microbacterium sp. No. 7 TaxID=1714373 RepID=UPI0006CFFDDB|nr:twin-arginine translocase TatA/TatE family subunit [Microbacterium sp. No. 7]ALJ19949.1 translocase [Microbacterium sp. No. 7]
MFFGLDMEKLIIIGVIAALLIGPERLPKAAEALTRFIRQARDWMRGAKGKMKDELGDDFDEIEWRKLDPRQYDPRRIIRDALLDDAPVRTVQAAAVGGAITAAAAPPQRFEPDGPVPFDDEAT